jgi:hypothetical protein
MNNLSFHNCRSGYRKTINLYSIDSRNPRFDNKELELLSDLCTDYIKNGIKPKKAFYKALAVVSSFKK